VNENAISRYLNGLLCIEAIIVAVSVVFVPKVCDFWYNPVFFFFVGLILMIVASTWTVYSNQRTVFVNVPMVVLSLFLVGGYMAAILVPHSNVFVLILALYCLRIILKDFSQLAGKVLKADNELLTSKAYLVAILLPRVEIVVVISGLSLIFVGAFFASLF